MAEQESWAKAPWPGADLELSNCVCAADLPYAPSPQMVGESLCLAPRLGRTPFHAPGTWQREAAPLGQNETSSLLPSWGPLGSLWFISISGCFSLQILGTVFLSQYQMF